MEEEKEEKMELLFITGNSAKVKSAQKCFDSMGLPVVVRQYIISLPEIQAKDAEEISQAKAKMAFEQIKLPLIVEDAGFHINALNGFPGVYVRYVLDTIGAEGIIKQMKGVEDRTCQFVAVTTFIDASGKIISFRDSEGRGVIASEVDKTSNPRAWSDLWKIYIPNGLTKTLSALTEEEADKHYQGKDKTKGSLYQFAEWLGTHLRQVNDDERIKKKMKIAPEPESKLKTH